MDYNSCQLQGKIKEEYFEMMTKYRDMVKHRNEQNCYWNEDMKMFGKDADGLAGRFRGQNEKIFEPCTDAGTFKFGAEKGGDD